MNPTRINLNDRLELVENRIRYLDEEIKKLGSEKQILTQEHELLQSFQKLYSSNKTDTIDSERRYICENPEPRKSIRDTILNLLKEIGPCTFAEVVSLSELGSRQVRNALNPLKLRKRVHLTDNGKWAIGRGENP